MESVPEDGFRGVWGGPRRFLGTDLRYHIEAGEARASLPGSFGMGGIEVLP